MLSRGGSANYGLGSANRWHPPCQPTALAPAVLALAPPSAVMLGCGLAIVAVAGAGCFRREAEAPILAE